MTVSVVNMIPLSLSGETSQDSEPSVAVNPASPTIIAASAFTPDPDPAATHAPIFVSTDGGATWELKSIVPYCEGMAADITLRFASASSRLYVGYLQTGGLGADLAVARTADPTFATEMELISQVQSGDQPYVQAATAQGGGLAGQDCLYVGFYDGFAKMHYSLDANIAQPTFKTVKLNARTPSDGVTYDLPQVRTAIHAAGVVYVVFYSVRGTEVDVVVVRDDQWGSGALPFTDLKDSGDGKPGQRVAIGVTVGNESFGQEGGEGELSIVVDPNDPASVYLAWADEQPGTGYTLHVRHSADAGQTWPETLWTVPMAQNPALAVTNAGAVGFLYQQFRSMPTGPRWETHFRYRHGAHQEDLVLATVPADEPANTLKTYLGDYVHLMAVGADFYGVFSANNTPDLANFPSTVTYQRIHNFTTKKLFDLDGVTEVPISIDPYFFKISMIEDRIRVLRHGLVFSIDPIAVLLPGDLYQRLVEKWHPHEPKLAHILAVVADLNDDQRAQLRSRARLVAADAALVEQALTDAP